MKIAMLGHKSFPSRAGGVETVVSELACRMQSRGEEVTVYNRFCGDKEEKPVGKEYMGVRIKRVRTFKNSKLNAMVYSLRASLRVAFSRYDVLHYHAIGSCAMMFIPRIMKKRLVVTVHGLDWQRAKWGNFAVKYLKFGEKCACKYADEIIVLSENLKKYYLDNYGRETHFVPNGITRIEPMEASEITKLFGLCKDGYILFLARIVPEKGLQRLIEAYSAVKTSKKLVIAGELKEGDSYAQSIKEAAKGNENIVFTGFVSGYVLNELYSNCFVYVLPSDIEGMPISLLEAVNYGARCLVSDIPESLQVIDGYGKSFKKGDTSDLQQALCSLLDEHESEKDYTARMAKREEILNRYNWDTVVDSTLEIYKSAKRKGKA